MAQKPKIFLLTPTPSPFAERDAGILRQDYTVRELILESGSGANGRWRKMVIFAGILRGVLWADITYSWFAHNHAYLAVILSRLFRKKSIVIVGGFEVANEPDIQYGGLLDAKFSRRVRYIIHNADQVFAVSDFNREEIQRLDRHRRIERVYNGIDCTAFTPQKGKEDLVITVCVITRAAIPLKGLDTFISAARALPQTKFAVIGRVLDDGIDILKQDAPSNVAFIESPSKKELLQWYRKARVYCQLSYRESFGVALAEAMSCECVPVVTDRGALPEIVGDTGFIVPYGDPESTAEAIQAALRSGRGKDARERVLTTFSIEQRQQTIRKAIDGRIA
ncbi:glycosyltransferase family 4 protein [Methanoculleus sp. FWC-SCC1]|uniref:Glycosyltransferase family 4 protein n=1 Tax=Methanoculleus frigidifontis TaxID=2584085 RepID=A0ABT8M7P6_9EURY|nr:glycosyltransferase family 4 protein [Methanoculleus sp. FWC-SCC1]MDN7023949.1 glycosyltransferase family 4 protein [Methanoculleus sp. FWC-SCC1]